MATPELVVRTFDQIRADFVDDVRNTNAKFRADGPGDDLYDIATATAVDLAEAHETLTEAIDESFDDTASLTALRKRNRHKVGDPHPATSAKITITQTGSEGATWSTADLLVGVSNGFVYRPLADGVMPAAATTTIALVAVTAGDAGALTADERVAWQSPPAGLAGEGVTTGDPVGGTNAESEDDYRARVLDYYRNPTGGGTLRDFETWVLSYPGVGFAAARANRRALGTVDVAVLDHEGDALAPEVLAGLQTYLDGVRPATARECRAVTPTKTGVSVTRRLVLAAGYGFSDFAAKTTTTGSTITAIAVDNIDGVGVGDWLAVRCTVGGRAFWYGREVLSTVAGSPPAITLKTALPAAPDAGETVRAAFPTFDNVARSIADYLATLKSGATFYNAVCDRAILQNPEVLNPVAVAPAADVQAVVDAFTWEHLTLGDLILEAAT